MQIDIAPPTNVYATFGRLNYTPWHAIAEFVDNASQSFLSHRHEIASLHGYERPLTVSIRHSKNELVIKDDAFGMGAEELGRALRLNAPPPDTSGRSEFGMGLKTAACWFGKHWSVGTTRLGDPWRYRIDFDVDAIASNGTTQVEVQRFPAPPDEHGTVLTITRLARPVAGRQVEKTKKLLTSMYRRDLLAGDMRLSWHAGERQLVPQDLTYIPPELFVWERDGQVVPARVEIDVYVVDPMDDRHKLHVRGWVGALQKMSEADSGLALLRRGRMIIGGPGGGWKPKDVVGSLNSHSGKRLIGELELDQFPVNFTKDGFAWDGGLEEELIRALQPVVKEIRDFADNARVAKVGRIEPADFVQAVHEVQLGVDSDAYKRAISGTLFEAHHEVSPARVGDTAPVESRDVPQELVVSLGIESRKVRLVLVDGGPGESWLTLVQDVDDPHLVHVRLNTGNKFVARHLDDERERTLLAKFALGVAATEQQVTAVFGDDVPPDEYREFLSLCLDHSVGA